MIGIYEIFCPTTNKAYIGASNCIEKRLCAHMSQLEKGKHHSKKLQADWALHGAVAFRFSVVEICLERQLRDRESFWIAYRKSFSNGYNGTEDSQYSCPYFVPKPKQQKEKEDILSTNQVRTLQVLFDIGTPITTGDFKDFKLNTQTVKSLAKRHMVSFDGVRLKLTDEGIVALRKSSK